MGPPTASRARILVADDNQDILRLVDVNLKFDNYDTVLAADGEDALRLARGARPDLILLDVLLPRLDGWQVLKALKSDAATRNIPVILMTAVSLRDIKDRELVHGVADYLPKPFNPLRLLEMVGDILWGRGRSRPAGAARPVAPAEQAKPAHYHGMPAADSVERTRVVLLAHVALEARVLRNFLGNAAIDIVAVVGPLGSGAVSLAREFNLRTLESLDELPAGAAVDLFVDTHEPPHAALSERAAQLGADVIRGGGLRFLSTLLAARDQTQKRERDLVRELNARLAEYSVLHEMSRLLTVPLELDELYARTLALAGRLSQIAVGAICSWVPEREKFTVAARAGVSTDFEERVQLSLSEPLVDEMLTFRRPLPVVDVRERYRSTLMAAAAREGMVSMLCLPIIVNEKVHAIMVLGTRERHEFGHEEVSLLSTLAGQAGMAIENQQLHAGSRHKQVIIEQLLAKVIAAQEDERKRLAAELHDSVAQQLAGMLTQIQIAQTLLTTGEREEAVAQLMQLRQVIGDSVKEVRQIIFNLRPSSLDDLGLIPSIENYVKRYEREKGPHVTLETRQRQRLPPALETTVFRLVQESLTNIKKHARAEGVRIRLHIDAHQVALAISDDGIGFSWAQMTDKFLRGDAHGVEGMKERTALLGGTFRIDSEEGKGTTVRVDIPLPREGEVASAVSGPEAATFVTRSVGSSELAAVSETLSRLGEQVEALVTADTAPKPPSRPRARRKRQ